MTETTRTPLKQVAFKQRFLFMLVWLLAMFVINPFIASHFVLSLFFDVFLTALLISGIYAIHQNKLRALIAVCLAVPVLISIWLSLVVDVPAERFISLISTALLLGYLVVNILDFIFRAEQVTRQVLFAAIVNYLLIGLLWSQLYSMLELWHPQSFSVPELLVDFPGQIFFYYSFVTITTLGYGDITPLTSMAANLASLEAVVGQIYMVVIVAWLVGMYVSRRTRK